MNHRWRSRNGHRGRLARASIVPAYLLVTTPLEFIIHTTYDYWEKQIFKHPGLEGFLVTAYITDKIKEGEIIWRK